MAGVGVDSGQQPGVFEHRLHHALVGQRQGVRGGGVGEREGRGARHGAGHVGDAVVHHPLLDVDRVRVGGRPGGLEATPLVDGHVHDHRAFLHLAQHCASHELRRGAARNEDGADQQVGPPQRRHHVVMVAGEGGERAVEDVVEITHAVEAGLEDGDPAPQPQGHLRRVETDDAAADDHHVTRRHAGHAGEQRAAAAMALLQVAGADHGGHPAGDLRHRRQQRQPALGVGDRLVGDAGDALGEQQVGQLGQRGEVKVGEQGLPLAQPLVLAGDRLLDLDHHLGVVGRVGIRHQPGAGIDIGLIRDAAADTGSLLHQHLVPRRRQRVHGGGDHGHPVLVVFDFRRDPDSHAIRSRPRRPRRSAAAEPPPCREPRRLPARRGAAPGSGRTSSRSYL